MGRSPRSTTTLMGNHFLQKSFPDVSPCQFIQSLDEVWVFRRISRCHMWVIYWLFFLSCTTVMKFDWTRFISIICSYSYLETVKTKWIDIKFHHFSSYRTNQHDQIERTLVWVQKMLKMIKYFPDPNLQPTRNPWTHRDPSSRNP